MTRQMKSRRNADPRDRACGFLRWFHATPGRRRWLAVVPFITFAGYPLAWASDCVILSIRTGRVLLAGSPGTFLSWLLTAPIAATIALTLLSVWSDHLGSDL